MGFVSFTMLKFAVGTIQEVIRWLQSLLVLEVKDGAKVGKSVGAKVGKLICAIGVGLRDRSDVVGIGSKVFVGAGVSVEISVGGTRVFVGSAA